MQVFGYSQMYSDTTTTTTGAFSVGVPAGATYIVQARKDGYLYASRSSVVVSEGITTTLPTIRLLGGDAVRDNAIDIYGLTTLGAMFGSAGIAADITGDGAVNIFDLRWSEPTSGARRR